MGFGSLLLLSLVLSVVIGIIMDVMRHNEEAKMSPAELAERRTKQEFGPLNPKLVCPHCQTTGQVRTKPIEQKKGISGGKASLASVGIGQSLASG